VKPDEVLDGCIDLVTECDLFEKPNECGFCALEILCNEERRIVKLLERRLREQEIKWRPAE